MKTPTAFVLAALLLGAAVLAPSAAGSASADLDSIARDRARGDKITPCRFTKAQLEGARKQLSPDVETYDTGLRDAINREVKRWRDGKCSGKRDGARLRIVTVKAKGAASKEYVTIKNLAGKTVNLRNYSLRDAGDHTIKLRSTKLKRGAKLRIVTGCRSGHRSPVRRGSRYYACRDNEVWDDASDVVELLGPGGGLLSKKSY